MKLALLGNYAKGLSLFRLDMIRAMTQAGMEVTAFFPSSPEAPQDAEEACAALSQIGAKAVLVPLERAGLSPTADLRYRHFVRRALAGQNFDAVLAYGIKPIIHGLPAATAAKVPLRLAMITGLGSAFIDVKTPKQMLVHWIARLGYTAALRPCQHVFFQNDDDRQVFRDLGLLAKSRPSSILPGSGVSLSHYQVQPLPDTSEGLRFVFVGRLLAHKGLLEYLAAASALAQTGQKAEFWVIGGEDPNPSALKLSDLKQAHPGVRFCGAVPDVRDYLAQAHVFVLPSYREGTPRSALEAMATGRAIIVSDAPGCRAIVRPGETGLQVAVRDPSGLQAAMQTYLDRPELCAQHGAAGRKLAEDQYDVALVNRQIIETLHDLDANRSAAK